MTQQTIPLHFRLLRDYIERSILGQPTRKAAAAAVAALDTPGRWRVITRWDLNPEGDAVDMNSLAYEVQVRPRDRWKLLCRVDWHLLGLEWADVQHEYERNLAAWEDGSYPGGPNDPTP